MDPRTCKAISTSIRPKIVWFVSASSIYSPFKRMDCSDLAEGGEVILTGRLENGRFESEEMAAKCPSKYEERPSADPDKSGR